MMALRKVEKVKGKYYVSDFEHEGKRYRKTHGRVTEGIAKTLDQQFRDDVISGKYLKEKTTFESFAIQYLKNKKLTCKPKGYTYYLTWVKPLARYFIGKEMIVKGDSISFKPIAGGKKRAIHLQDITPSMVQNFKHERAGATVADTGKPISNCTINKPIRVLRNLLNDAKKLKVISENVISDVELLREKPKDPKVLTSEKEIEFFTELAKNNQRKHMIPIAMLAINTGMRKREILDLEIEQLNLGIKPADNYILLENTKNGENRIIPLTVEMQRVLIEAMATSKGKYVFTNKKTGKPYNDPRKSFTTAMENIGLKGQRFHWNRHTFCSRMQEAGIDAPTIMEVGGWKTNSMVKRYSHMSLGHKLKALETIQNGDVTIPDTPTTLKLVTNS